MNLKKINTLMRPNSKPDPPFIIDSNKIIHSDSKDISNAFSKFSDEVPTNLTKDMPDSLVDYTSNIKLNNKSMILFYTTPNEIIPIIKNLKNSKSLDNIPTKLLKIAHQEVYIILAKLFNTMIDDSKYPDFFKVCPLNSGS